VRMAVQDDLFAGGQGVIRIAHGRDIIRHQPSTSSSPA
jgi:hypothetical protein